MVGLGLPILLILPILLPGLFKRILLLPLQLKLLCGPVNPGLQ